MGKSLILISCFTPLAVIFVIMKLSVWMSAIDAEQKYVKRDSKLQHGPYMENAYADLDQEDEEYGSRTDYQ